MFVRLWPTWTIRRLQKSTHVNGCTQHLTQMVVLNMLGPRKDTPRCSLQDVPRECRRSHVRVVPFIMCCAQVARLLFGARTSTWSLDNHTYHYHTPSMYLHCKEDVTWYYICPSRTLHALPWRSSPIKTWILSKDNLWKPNLDLLWPQLLLNKLHLYASNERQIVMPSTIFHTISYNTSIQYRFFWGGVLAWNWPTSDICIIVKWMSVPLVRTPLMYPPFGND